MRCYKHSADALFRYALLVARLKAGLSIFSVLTLFSLFLALFDPF
jgi:hypothetical protein